MYFLFEQMGYNNNKNIELVKPNSFKAFFCFIAILTQVNYIINGIILPLLQTIFK